MVIIKSEFKEGMLGMHHPQPGIFNKVFSEYHFSIILNLFGNNKP